MLTLLLYVLIVGLVAAVLFLLASAVFGRGEELGPLPEGTTATVLPAEGISGADVRALRFQQVVRGYKAGEVDWALARLAARIDELQLELAHARSAAISTAVPRGTQAPQQQTQNAAQSPLAGLTGPQQAVTPQQHRPAPIAEPGGSQPSGGSSPGPARTADAERPSAESQPITPPQVSTTTGQPSQHPQSNGDRRPDGSDRGDASQPTPESK